MQPRFAALLFALGLADLAYVNLGLGRELFTEVEAPAAPVATPREQAPVPELAVEQAAPEPSPAPVPLPQPAAHEHATDAPPPAPSASAVPEIEATAGDDPAQPAPHADVSPSDTVTPSAPAAERAADGRTGRTAASIASDPELPGSKLTVTFPDTASAWLTGRARERVLALAAQLRAHPELRLVITGHADARGTREFNLSLGGRRARAVTDLLAKAGVSREQIEMESRGEDEPKARGASERVWAANRRVEVHVETGRNEAP